MSQTASPRRKSLLIALLALIVVGAGGYGVWQLGGDDDAPAPKAIAPQASEATTPSPTATPTPTPTVTSTPTATPPTSAANCEGPDTQFNVEGVKQDSLLPDCGTVAVTSEQEQKSGLGLACGGSYPVIIYKTTTSGAKTSICGKDSSGAELRFVTKPKGGEVLDLSGTYEPQLDAFVAKNNGIKYTVPAYNGDLLVTKDGKTTTQKSDGGWISLDNESDYD